MRRMGGQAASREIRNVISSIPHPEVNRSIGELGMLSAVRRSGDRIEVEVVVNSESYELLNVLKSDIEAAAAREGGTAHITFKQGRVDTGVARDAPSRVELNVVGQPQRASGIDALDRKGVRSIIAVASGKGGVGKSFVTATVATHLALSGFRVGVLDADITGPSISRMFSLTQMPRLREDKMMEPLASSMGLKIMSIDVIMDRFQTPLVWRGPLINSAIRGLFSETDWGELHYLLVDLPPGTSDAPLTVFQSLRPDGVMFVTSPQLIANTVVSRAVQMANEMNAPVLGVVENMSYLQLADGTRLNVFGRMGAEDISRRLGLEFMGSLPLDPAVSQLADRGEIELYRRRELFDIARSMRSRLLSTSGPKRAIYEGA